MSRPIVPQGAPFRSGETKNPSKKKAASRGPLSAALQHHQRQQRPVRHRQHRFELVSSQTKLILRVTALALVTGHFVSKTFQDQLLPHGPPVELTDRSSPLSIDRHDNLLQFQHGRTQRIYERLNEGDAPILNGPETVVVHPKTGSLFVMTADARLLLLSDLATDADDTTRVTAKTAHLQWLGAGRPLGGAFTPDGKTLYIADAVLGLTRIHNPMDPKNKLELVVTTIPMEKQDAKVEHSRLWFVDDVTIGPKTGNVYFTDATDIAADRIGYKTNARWDTLHASKLDLIRGKGAGRVLEYSPATDTTRVLVDGLKFANGLGIDKDETFLLVSQTFGPRMSKYHLKGDEIGTLETVLEPEHLTGYPDGADCAWEGSRKCYAAIPSAFSPVHSLYNMLPDPLDRILRAVLLMLPRWLAPAVQKYGGVVELDPMTKEYRYIQDPSGKDIAMVTGVTYHDKKLYLGSLENDYIGVYTLNE